MVKSSMFSCIHLINMIFLPCAKFLHRLQESYLLRIPLEPLHTELVVAISPLHSLFIPNSVIELITMDSLCVQPGQIPKERYYILHIIAAY